ncbi:MAG: hypothetical protein Q4C50_06110 [Eubacteriales bacterium]|nr:hypothetical protein [Eubacteriales bacterium]
MKKEDATRKDMEKTKAGKPGQGLKGEAAEQALSPTWAQECIEDIDDWIESQGIYLRQ